MICKTYLQFFSTLADATRLEIIKSLRESPKSVQELCTGLDMEQSRVSHNLRKLKECGFLVCTPSGKQRIYDIDRDGILPILKLIDKHVDNYYSHYCKCSGKEREKRWKEKGYLGGKDDHYYSR